VAHDHHIRGHFVHEISVMLDEEQCGLEIQNHLFDLLAGKDIDVI